MWTEQLINELLANENKENQAPMQKYMRDKFAYLGIKTPQRREICKAYFKEAKREEGIRWDFVKRCWESPYREMQYTAVNYLLLKKDSLKERDIDKIKKLITAKSWWDTVDGLDQLAGHLAFTYPAVRQTVLDWSVEEDFWLRRTAIDCQLQRKDKTDTTFLEEAIINNLNQKEFFINKAIGWSLREYSKTDAEWVRNFLARNKDGLAALSIREAGKYL